MTSILVGPRLGEQLRPCGPVIDAAAAERARERLMEAAVEGGWSPTLDAAWPALAPVFAASPYLFGLARRWPERLKALLEATPDVALDRVLSAASTLIGGADAVRTPLRRLKGELHLLTALCDLGGVWDLDQVTGALSRFADVSTQAALGAVAEDQREAGKLVSAPD
ncbi:MAG TPA: glutamine-synthetase adenylyltransferase, partial [Brevundimonas sp.]|nr:glutamine-synthetase adenylyltransferase [Brevundimonas sp.]